MPKINFRYALSRQGHKDAPMRYLNPDEVAEKVPILNMDNVSLVILSHKKDRNQKKTFNVKEFCVFFCEYKFVPDKMVNRTPVIFNFYKRNRHHDD